MSRRWITERRREPYHRMAKEQGYRSRAAFKLKQLNSRFGFLDGARYVLDMGAAPGGWLQVASEVVGDRGLVVGVDLESVKPLGLNNVMTIVGDVTDGETLKQIIRLFPGKVDVVLSDLAPNVSGVWDVDHLRQVDLSRIALMLSEKLLKPEGWFVVKVFQGFEYNMFLEEVKSTFSFVKVVKSKASRKASAEIYLVAGNLRNFRK